MENHATPVPNEKACSICNLVKPLPFFENDKRRPDGHGPRCKECIRDKVKKGIKVTIAKLEKAKEVVETKVTITKDKYGVERSASNQCDCGHYVHEHIEVQNPDGPGTKLVCWKGHGEDRCQCREFKHNGKNEAQLDKAIN